eukprot:TRINITY_DN2799_c0_g1_i1.p1 TRINITY_DN2799_c0_g1~~TRINITY_DN2799_c0_g1_i1.p1  ORF type:complete len:294 (-),score=86.00 TRINITY_DN2799_c0_g1_i1:64-945(-)
MGFGILRHLALLALFLFLQSSAQSTDGGRGDLPGMKRDMFDQINKQKQQGGAGAKEKKRPECPKSDQNSPFTAFAIVGGNIYVKFNESDATCRRLTSVAGANISSLFAAARTCGAVGEWKRRVAEELSAMYFITGGEGWPKSDGEPIEVELEDGNYSIPITPANYELIKDCWARGCGCEQAANPKMKVVMLTLLAIALSGLGWDVFKMVYEKFFGGKKKDKEKKEKKDKKEKKEKKEKKTKKGDGEATGDESTAEPKSHSETEKEEEKSEKDTEKSETDKEDKSETEKEDEKN